jgi:hypothetical protein
VAKLILDDVVRLHVMPKSIVSDRDRIFISGFWKDLFKLHDTSLLISNAYHPQTDGQTEGVNQCLEMFLRCSIHNTPRKWKAWLSLTKFWYNTSYHSSLECTPFKVLYRYDPTVVAAPMLPSIDNMSV